MIITKTIENNSNNNSNNDNNNSNNNNYKDLQLKNNPKNVFLVIKLYTLRGGVIKTF